MMQNRFQLFCRRLNLSVYIGERELQSMCTHGEMASTWSMNVFHMWMEYTQPQHISDRYWIVDPLWVQLYTQTNKANDILGQVPECDFVFIPIVHEGHWVLWVKMRHAPTDLHADKVTSPVVFIDPMNNPATRELKSLAEMAITKVTSTVADHKIIPENRYTKIHIPTQPNGTDCGYYVMQTIRMFVEEFAYGLKSPNFVSILLFPFSIVTLDYWFLYILFGRVLSIGTKMMTSTFYALQLLSGHDVFWVSELVT